MSGFIDLAFQAKVLHERVELLKIRNTPLHEADRKQALIDLRLAEVEAKQAEDALRALNPYQDLPQPRSPE